MSGVQTFNLEVGLAFYPWGGGGGGAANTAASLKTLFTFLTAESRPHKLSMSVSISEMDFSTAAVYISVSTLQVRLGTRILIEMSCHHRPVLGCRSVTLMVGGLKENDITNQL